jgi:hypothetical protein
MKGSQATPPWRRRLVAANDAKNDVSRVRSLLSPTTSADGHASEDDASTATGCSDAEDTVSTLSRSSSEIELQNVVSRDVMLLLRSRCLRTSAESSPVRDLHCKSLVTSPPGLAAKAPAPAPAGFVPPPGLELLNGAAAAVPAYTPPRFRKEFMVILKELAMDRNVARAVRRVRAQGVPRERQAAEYADAITFILEETRGAARRSFVALLAGLAYGVFEKKQCLLGLDIFFHSVFADLEAEVPKLSKLVNIELLATLSSVFTAGELSPFVALAKP